MITLLLLVVAGLAVLGAGEAVRGQCRRMLARPVLVRSTSSMTSVRAGTGAQPG